LDPKNEGQYLYNMVGVHQERSEWKAAKTLLTRMLALDPLSSETHESLGVVQATRRDYASALAAFSKSLALLPRRKHFDASDRVRLTTSVADTHMNQEHFALALAAFQEALASVSAQQAQGLPAKRLDRMLATQSSALYCALKICAWREAGPLRHSIVETWASLSDNRSAALEVACMHACVWMYVCMYVCVYLCTFACMRACVWM
jgi:tetratricopeptide (TPR) repeat protein